jgi:hypothetical protein
MNSNLKDIQLVLRAELEEAQRSRKQGNEGKARVCARRAAGWAIGAYVEMHSLAEPHSNALEHLKWLVENYDVSDELREAANRLTTKVDVDGNLPFREDPISDAQLIITALLGKEFPDD